ncbi:ABC transporter permease [Sulfitobacter sp. F26204]|uniref:ABC transporter permease n=1 Tax=Sulfitobacter sp. F26204 TaxID=2996014 RepID=UPI00225E4EEE|nr:ABC transporter permease [Sulfitobacter sp. F26204]MCX7561458.1 ABC transporter permease [Sulfitobacter sp. F26204]
MTLNQTGNETVPAYVAPNFREKCASGLRYSLLPTVVFIGLLIFWETVVHVMEVPGYIFPAPSAVGKAFYHGIASGVYFIDLGVTAFEAVFGFILGSFLGIALGTIIVIFPLMERIVYPYVVALQTVPKVAIAPLLVVWFGFGISSKVIIVGLVCLFPVLVNVIAGLRAVDDERLDLLAALSATRWQIFRHLRFPNAMPFVFAGLNTAIVLSVIGAIVGEFVGATKGVGFRILQANYSLDIAAAFALFVLLSLMGLTMHSTLKFIERRTVFWTKSQDIRDS